jgi:MraZ protein
MFRGRYEHSLDEKGRLAVPVKFREKIPETDGAQLVMVTNLDQYLAAYTLPEWEKIQARFSELPQFDPVVENFLHYFIGGVMECPIDKTGRILLPPSLRQAAGIDRDCVLNGILTKFAIWSAERWASRYTEITDQFGDMAKGIARLGIRL